MSPRQALSTLIKNGLIPPQRLDDAIEISGIHPSKAQWLMFIDRFMLSVGALFIALAIIFFFAYNWADLSRFTKFACAEIGVTAAVIVYLISDRDSVLSKVMLLSASLLVGALLALFGQTYQTGADTWQLFFNWALLILPWVIISRFPALWLAWLGLLNLSAALYFKTFSGFFNLIFLPLVSSKYGLLWCLFILNSIALLIWEAASSRFDWLKPRWPPRIIALAGGIPISCLAMLNNFDAKSVSLFAIPAWLLWAAVVYLYYRRRRRDLFMLAGLTVSFAAVLITYVAEPIFKIFDSGGFLIIAGLVIGAGSGAALWLRSVHVEWSK